MFYSIKQLIAEVRKPGNIEVDVNSEHDCFCMLIQKSDLLAKLKAFPANSESPWLLVDVGHEDGTKRLSVISDFDREHFKVEDMQKGKY